MAKCNRARANERQFRYLDAVGVVIGIVEVVLDKTSFITLCRCANDLRQDRLASDSVQNVPGQELEFVFVWKRTVEQGVAGAIDDEQVDRTGPPRTVFVAKDALKYSSRVEADRFDETSK